jgi:hypothetical protein
LVVSCMHVIDGIFGDWHIWFQESY